MPVHGAKIKRRLRVASSKCDAYENVDYQEIREYPIRQRARNVAETPWLILPGDNKLTRRALKLRFIKDHKDPDKFVGVHVEVLFQTRKNQKESWPSRTVNLAQIPKNFGFKFALDSAQTSELEQALQDAYSIGKGEISSGKRTVVRGAGRDEIIVTDKNKAAALQRLTSLLNERDLNEWMAKNISALPTDLALARLYNDRRTKLAEFKRALNGDHNERFWQELLKANPWMFGTTYVEILSERRLDIHHTTDFPLRVEGGFMDIVEIKTPRSPFWALEGSGTHYKYRDKYLIPHRELQGAITQTTKYILQAEKNVDSADYANDHGGVVPLKPRGLIIHGRSTGWKKEEWEAFRLLNDELHTVQVITFDHLLRQADRMLAVMNIRDENPTPEDIEVDDLSAEDFPF